MQRKAASASATLLLLALLAPPARADTSGHLAACNAREAELVEQQDSSIATFTVLPRPCSGSSPLCTTISDFGADCEGGSTEHWQCCVMQAFAAGGIPGTDSFETEGETRCYNTCVDRSDADGDTKSSSGSEPSAASRGASGAGGGTSSDTGSGAAPVLTVAGRACGVAAACDRSSAPVTGCVVAMVAMLSTRCQTHTREHTARRMSHPGCDIRDVTSAKGAGPNAPSGTAAARAAGAMLALLALAGAAI